MADAATPPQSRTWLVPVLIAVIAGLLLYIVLREPATESAAAADPTPSSSAVDAAPTAVAEAQTVDLSQVERRDPDDLLATGAVDAPVVLVVFSDYQCTYCAIWSDETLPAMQEYVERGDLRIEWRDVNIFGEDSERAALASYAAARQDAFWEYHQALFADGEPRSAAGLTEDALLELAGELGLDADQFAGDMASDEAAAAIDENAQLGLSLGAYSTPAFILGGVPLVGAQPAEVFTQALDEALAAA